MNLVDVTLRDGGFTCDFDWPMHFAHEYYNLMSNLGISYIEMGYWKQTVKSKNKFFNLDLDTVKEVTGEQGKNNVSVMIDYSYCSKDLNEYPTDSQNEIKMIRMTCRKDMIKEGFEFAVNLKKHTNLEIAFNLFNTTNYTDDELNSALDIVLDSDFDIIGFADTHGHLNLHRDIKRYEHFFKRIKDSGKNTCFHLHNHTGKAYMNYIMCLESPYVDFCDTSVMSLGKGAGNLKLENVLDDTKSLLLNEFIHKYYESLFKKTVSPYLMVTGRYGITDHYATQARKLELDMNTFVKFCSTVTGLNRDNFDKNLLVSFNSYRWLS
jgi:4-hydroxy 2-oxovalerate aldolase|tara:strand:+ start:1311 stop:2276 length:966 start_codon:yes stop_codon:yes gene_type:complete